MCGCPCSSKGIPPAEAEANFNAALETEPMAAELTTIGFRQTRRGSIS